MRYLNELYKRYFTKDYLPGSLRLSILLMEGQCEIPTYAFGSIEIMLQILLLGKSA
jgi:hypothetical protein